MSDAAPAQRGTAPMLQAARVLLVAVSALLVALSLLASDVKFFTLHPALMAVWAFALGEGLIRVQTVRRARDGRNLVAAVDHHWQLESVGLVALVFGYLVAYMNKDLLGKEHFISWHSYMGTATLVVAFIQVLIGMVGNFGDELLESKAACARSRARDRGSQVDLHASCSSLALCGGSACTASMAT